MKVNIKGKVISVSDEILTGETRMVRAVLHSEFFDNSTGTKKGEDWFETTIFNDNIEKLRPKELLGKTVNANCYLNGRKSEKDGKVSYYANLACVEVNVLRSIENQPS
jgi:hypothetical protein